MSDDGFTAGAGGAIAFAILIGVPSCAGCHNLGMSDIRAQAIERGLGEYRVDQKSQRVEFYWTVKADGNSVQVEKTHPAADIVKERP